MVGPADSSPALSTGHVWAGDQKGPSSAQESQSVGAGNDKGLGYSREVSLGSLGVPEAWRLLAPTKKISLAVRIRVSLLKKNLESRPLLLP